MVCYFVNFILSTKAHLSFDSSLIILPCPTRMYVHSHLMPVDMTIFGSLGCKCLSHVYQGNSHFIIRPSKSCHCLPSLVLVVIIWLLVFDSLIFRVYFNSCTSCSPYLQACHAFTTLKHNRICFKPCRVRLSNCRY